MTGVFAAAPGGGGFFDYELNVNALVALVLVSLTCGALGSQVVASRMAFFSDALAHCAFAGVSLGFLLFTLLLARTQPGSAFWDWVTPLMATFGAAVGAGIAYVRQRTGLASDTVIGVFFAGAIGLAALLRELIRSREFFALEDFLFGNLLLVTRDRLLPLAALTVATFAVLAWISNQLLLTNFNPSLALSRRVPTALCNYALIVLLAVCINVCLRYVGVMLITGLLIVPAATAMNLCRNMRQLFWLTIGLTLGMSLAGLAISWEIETRSGLRLGTAGAVVLVGVALFAVSAAVGPLLRGRPGPAGAR